MFEKAWEGFKGTAWKDSINVRAFIQENYAPYHGDDTFWKEQQKLLQNCGNN